MLHALPLVISSSLALAGPEAPSALELADAIELAEQHDQRFLSVEQGQQAAMFETGQAVQRFLPTLSAEAGLTRNAREIKIGQGADERIVSQLYVPRASTQARLTLVRLPDWPGAVSALHRYGAVRAEAGEQRDALRADVAALFLDVAEARAVLAAQRAAAERARSLLEVARARVVAGEAVPLEAADAEAEALRAEAELAATRGTEQALLALLRVRLGLERGAPVDVVCQECVAPPVEQPGEEVPLEPLDERRGDLLGLARRTRAARLDEVGAWANLLPTVDVVGNLRLQQPTLFNPDPVWWTAEVVLRWDIVGPSSGGVLRSLQLNRQASQAGTLLEVARREASAELLGARARLEAQEAAYVASEAREKAAGTALEQAEARYQGGLMSSADVLEVSRRKAEADRDLARAQYQRLRARLALRRALGLGPLDDGELHD